MYIRAMTGWIKRTAVQLAVGASLGFTAWSLIGAWLTSLMFSSLGGTFSCKADVEAALSKFISMQMYSALAGGVGAVVLMTLVRRRFAKRTPTPADGGVSV